MTNLVVDLFAGAGGWDLGARAIGIEPVGIESDRWACTTRAAVGLRTIRADVTQLSLEPFADAEGLIASPPCPDFSIAGRRAGIEGQTGRLMWQVPRWVQAVRPRWVACEQVPLALPWWEQFGAEMRTWGYRTWTGLLNSADYGVPQTRVRAILLAHRDRQPWPPEPTHSKHPGGFDELLSWVSLAEALGWSWAPEWSWEGSDGTTRCVSSAEPAHTVMGHRSPRWAYGERAVLHTNRGQDRHGRRQMVSVGRSAPTVSGKAGGQWVFDRPATTIAADARIAKPGHHDWGNGRVKGDGIKVELWELGVLQGFPHDYPWQGNKTQRATQIGNAVPPPLAAAVLGALTGLP